MSERKCAAGNGFALIGSVMMHYERVTQAGAWSAGICGCSPNARKRRLQEI